MQHVSNIATSMRRKLCSRRGFLSPELLYALSTFKLVLILKSIKNPTHSCKIHIIFCYLIIIIMISRPYNQPLARVADAATTISSHSGEIDETSSKSTKQERPSAEEVVTLDAQSPTSSQESIGSTWMLKARRWKQQASEARRLKKVRDVERIVYFSMGYVRGDGDCTIGNILFHQINIQCIYSHQNVCIHTHSRTCTLTHT